MKTIFPLAAALIILVGCGPAVKERTSPARTSGRRPPADAARGGDSAARKPDPRSVGGAEKPKRNSPDSPDALRRDRDRLRRELSRLYGERRRRDAELGVTKDFLADMFGALQSEDYPRAMASIDRFLRAHPGHSLGPPISALRPTVEKLQAGAAEREALREEIRSLKDIQFRFDNLSKEGS